MMQIDLTWNLFATPLYLILLGIIGKWYFETRFKDLNNAAVGRYEELEASIKAAETKRELQLRSKVDLAVCEVIHKLVTAGQEELKCDIKEIKASINKIFDLLRERDMLSRRES
jgi:hypothetical protein